MTRGFGRLWPARSRHRVALGMVLALLVSHAAAFLVYDFHAERSRDLLTAHRLGPAMAAAVAAAEGAIRDATPPGPAADAHATPELAVHWQATPGPPPPGWRLTPAAGAPRAVVAVTPDTPRLTVDPGADDRALLSALAADLAAHLRPARLRAQLADGSWLEFTSPRWRERETPFRLILLLVAGLAAAGGLIVWLSGRLVRPLEVLAERAAQPDDTLTPEPLPEAGPVEVAGIARAVNAARGQVREMVEGRTRLLAAISHDLRTPATRLRLRAEYVADEALRAKMLADVDEMAAMIAATLEFLSEDVLREEVEVVAFASLLQSLCDDCADLGMPVSFREPPPLSFGTVRTVFGGAGEPARFDQPRQLRLAGRPASLRRAFGNLIDNAVKYGERAHVAIDADSREIMVEVLDDGPGIPEDELETVFKPFFRLEASRNRRTGGCGLGLSIVKSIVEAHHGRIELLNRLSGGLRVRVTLPRMLP